MLPQLKYCIYISSFGVRYQDSVTQESVNKSKTRGFANDAYQEKFKTSACWLRTRDHETRNENISDNILI